MRLNSNSHLPHYTNMKSQLSQFCSFDFSHWDHYYYNHFNFSNFKNLIYKYIIPFKYVKNLFSKNIQFGCIVINSEMNYVRVFLLNFLPLGCMIYCHFLLVLPRSEQLEILKCKLICFFQII